MYEGVVTLDANDVDKVLLRGIQLTLVQRF
jgi:hypothetical protein